MSLWDDGSALFGAQSSFPQAIPDPGTDPTAGDQVQVQFSAAWLPYVLGSLQQLTQPPTWGMTGSSDSTGVLGRATKLLNLFSEAVVVVPEQEGIATLTILAGTAQAIAVITFSPAFVSPPIVDVSCDDPNVIASWGEVTGDAMTIAATVAVVLTSDLTVEVSWHAG
ncbi:MAG TPA: hypothetical protein VGS80_22175 [Ktedonobacterales bacterium]|nr:hypothetical protein [Ktedonobacterales bacterium]